MVTVLLIGGFGVVSSDLESRGGGGNMVYTVDELICDVGDNEAVGGT